MKASVDRIETTLGLLLDAIGAHPTVRDDVVWATLRGSLRGIDTHGIAMVPKILQRVSQDRAQVREPAAVVGERAAAAVIDARLSPGQHACMLAAREASRRASELGVGLATVRNSTHFGCCTPFLELICDNGQIGFIGSNSLRSMAAFGSGLANLGNNPFGFGAPRLGEDGEGGQPFLFDFSAAVMSFGRRNEYRARGAELPDGAFVEPDASAGEEGGVCEIADSLAQLAVPFGGFKGASIAMMIEVFSGLLSSGNFGAKTETFDEDERFLGPSHFALAVDPQVFGATSFLHDMRTYVEQMRRGNDDMRIPGDRSAEAVERRTREGIPLSGELAEAIDGWCERLGVAPLRAGL